MTCASCNAEFHEGIYDHRTDLFFCDLQCFKDWCDHDAYETVILYYANDNITEVEDE